MFALKRKIHLAWILILMLALAACSGSVGQAPGDAPVQDTPAAAGMATGAAMPGESHSDDMGMTPGASTEEPAEMMKETPEAAAMPTGAMMEPTPDEAGMPAEEMMDAPAFFEMELTDAASGETFTIGGLHGQVALVETLAMWCSNCMRQQQQVVRLHELLGEREDFVSLGLDIDPNERLEDLQAYVQSNGFDWKYAVAPGEMAGEIGRLYGDQFLNPPSTPMFVIDRSGQVHPLPFGIKSAEELQAALEPFLAEAME